MEKRTDHICKVCQGWIMERSEIPYVPAVSKDLFGPGSRNIATEADRLITGWHCGSCGIEYRKPPNR